MGGALARPATIPNAVAGRDGAFALTVVAPAPPPLAAVAPVVTSHVVDAVAPWTTGIVAGQLRSATGAPDSAWAPEVLDRLRRVKAAVDPRDVFGGVVSASAPGRGGCPMNRQVVVVEPGQGDRVGNVEFLARTIDTPLLQPRHRARSSPGRASTAIVHAGEDDSWLVLEGTLSVTVGDERRVLRAGPGTFVLVPAGTYHALANDGPEDVRFLNIHSPGGFDRRIGWQPHHHRRHSEVRLT